MSASAKQIHMIAWFNIDGKINPVNFKYDKEDDDTKVILLTKF